MAHSVTLIPGSSTEDSPTTAAVARVIEAAGVDVAWERASLANGARDPDLLASIRRTGATLMPYVPVDRATGDLPPIVELRRALGVFGNVRPLESVPGLATRHPDVDLIIVRETTEDVYASLEHESIEGVFESFKVTTEGACERITRFAFELAKKQGRRKVSIVHKANIMKRSDGLFLRTGKRVAEEYPDIEVEDVIVDALCMKLVLHPERFDVLVCANLFGDIVADLCAGLVGGTHNAPSVNVADGAKIYTAGHGDDAATAYTEQASPTSLLFSAILMLRDLGEDAAADRVMTATSSVLEGGMRPVSLGGEATSTDFADAIVQRL